jgi:hypothetical protein
MTGRRAAISTAIGTRPSQPEQTATPYGAARDIAVKEAQHDDRDRTPESDALHNLRRIDPHHAPLLELFCRDLLDSGWAAWVGSDPMTLEPVINPKTAKTVVLRMPPLLLVCPDKVIQ